MAGRGRLGQPDCIRKAREPLYVAAADNSRAGKVAVDSVLDKFLAALAQTERLPPADLARYQAGLVERIARHAYENSPLYRARLAVLFRPDGSFDPRRWREVEVLGRDEAAANMMAMRLELSVFKYGATIEKHTSG